MVTLGSQESTQLMVEMGFHKVESTERIKVRLEKLLYGSALSSTKSPLFVYRDDKAGLILQIKALQSKLQRIQKRVGEMDGLNSTDSNETEIKHQPKRDSLVTLEKAIGPLIT